MTSAPNVAEMDCEQCEKGLLELSYGELDEASAAATRAHLEHCAACRQAFQKIEMGRAFARRLELEPAPSMVAVLTAAREQALANRAARETAPERAPEPRTMVRADRDEEESGPAAWLRRLGAFVMGPQLGVATVLLLVVGIGLWYLPQLGGGAGRDVPTLIEPDPQQASEATALAPAEPLQLTHDPRTGRVTVETATGERHEGVDGEREERPAITARRAAEPRAPVSEVAPREDSASEHLDEQALAAVERTVDTEETPGRVQDDSLPELTSAAGAYEGAPLPPTPSPAPLPSPEPSAPRYAGGSTTAPATTAPATTAPATTASEEVLPGGPRADDLGAAALHGQARQLAAAGRCADAVGRYHQLQARHPSYAESGRASLEMADCLRRLGRTSEARAQLERASRSPVASVAGAARREIVELDTAARAADRNAAVEPASE